MGQEAIGPVSTTVGPELPICSCGAAGRGIVTFPGNELDEYGVLKKRRRIHESQHSVGPLDLNLGHGTHPAMGARDQINSSQDTGMGPDDPAFGQRWVAHTGACGT